MPIYNRQFDKDGHYAEYVETAEANEKFIIARTVQVKDKRKNYWIITKDFKHDDCNKLDCDSIIQSKVIGPLDPLQSRTKIAELNIALQFSEP